MRHITGTDWSYFISYFGASLLLNQSYSFYNDFEFQTNVKHESINISHCLCSVQCARNQYFAEQWYFCKLRQNRIPSLAPHTLLDITLIL